MTRPDSDNQPAIAPECVAPWEIQDALDSLRFIVERLGRRLDVLERDAARHLQAYRKHVTQTHKGWRSPPGMEPAGGLPATDGVRISAGKRSRRGVAVARDVSQSRAQRA